MLFHQYGNHRIPEKNILLSTGGVKQKAETLDAAKTLVAHGYKIFATPGSSKFLTENGVENTLVHWPSEEGQQPQAIDMLHRHEHHTTQTNDINRQDFMLIGMFSSRLTSKPLVYRDVFHPYAKWGKMTLLTSFLKLFGACFQYFLPELLCDCDNLLTVAADMALRSKGLHEICVPKSVEWETPCVADENIRRNKDVGMRNIPTNVAEAFQERASNVRGKNIIIHKKNNNMNRNLRFIKGGGYCRCFSSLQQPLRQKATA